MSDLEQRLNDDLNDISDESTKDLNYKPTYLLAMLRERGALATARHLLHKEGISEGFTKLWEAKRLDLTVEAIVLKPEYATLFTDAERAIARRRLAEVNYSAPWDQPAPSIPLEPTDRSSSSEIQSSDSLLKANQHAAAAKLPTPNIFNEAALDALIEQFKQRYGSFKSRRYLEDEREYKIHAVEKLRNFLEQQAFKQLIETDNIEEAHIQIRRAMSGNNLLNQWDVRPILDGEPATLVRAMYELLYGNTPFDQRFEAWIAGLSQTNAKCWPSATYHLMLHDPAQHIFVKPMPFRALIKQIKPSINWQTHPTAAAYQQLRELSAAILDRLRSLGARDMIDVQSFIWIVQQEPNLDAENDSDDQDDNIEHPTAKLSLAQWRAQLDTIHPLALHIAAEYPEWLEQEFGLRIEFRPGNRQTFWVLINGRWMQRGRINKRGGMWMWLRDLSVEDQQYLHSELEDPTTLQDRMLRAIVGQRFILNSEGDYQLLQEITRRMVERSLEELWQVTDNSPTFVVIHSRDWGSQVYGETYAYTNYASGAQRQLTNALRAFQNGGPAVRLIIYRPAPHYAFTAWAEVVEVTEAQGQRIDELLYTLTLDQREFPVPLNLKGNGKALINQLEWLSKGLAVAFNGQSIRPISIENFRTIIEVAQMATEATMSLGDAAYTILSKASGSPLDINDILNQAKERKLIAANVTITALSSAMRSDDRFSRQDNSLWLLVPTIEPDSIIDNRDPVSEVDESVHKLGKELRFWRIHQPRSYWEDSRQHNVVAIGFIDNPNSTSVNYFRSIKVGDRIVAYVQNGNIGGFGVVTSPFDEHDPLAGTPAGLFGGTLQRRLRVAWSDLPATPTNVATTLNERHQPLYNKIVNPHTVRPLKREDYVILLTLSEAVDPAPRNESRLPNIWSSLASYRDFVSDLEDHPYNADSLLQAAKDENDRLPADLDGEALAEALGQLRLLTIAEPGQYRRQNYATGNSDTLLRLMVLALLIPIEGTADQYTLPARMIFQRHHSAPMPQSISDFAPELGDDNRKLLTWYSQAGLVEMGQTDWRWSDDAFDPSAEQDTASRMYSDFLRTLLDDISGQLKTDIDHANGPLPVAANHEAGLRTLGADMLIDDQILRRIYRSLMAGRNIVLSGPPGTGKTELAKRLPTLLWEEPPQHFTRLTTSLEQMPVEQITVHRKGYNPIIVTATEDWGVRDIIGGIAPRLNSDNGSLAYDIQYGHLTQALLRHYADTDNGRRPPTTDDYNRRDYVENGQRYRGVWLVIDEFTRAPVDAAFGGLLTMLGGGNNARLNVPSGDFGSISIPLPADFRIIGTLNSFDRHFLSQMSEAIKRRFDFIDVLPPSATYARYERGIAARTALNRLQEQGFSEIIALPRANGRMAYQYGDVLIEPVSDEQGAPRYELNASGAAAAALDSFWRLFEVIRIFRQLGTAQAIAIYTNIFAGMLVNMSWTHALDTALADSLVDQLQVMTRDEQRIVRDYVKTADTAALTDAINATIHTLPANRRPEIYALLHEVDEARNGTSDIGPTITETQTQRLFKPGTLALPTNSVFLRRLSHLISERGL